MNLLAENLVVSALNQGDPQTIYSLAGAIDWTRLAAPYEHPGDLIVSASYATQDDSGMRKAALALMMVARQEGYRELFETWEADEGGTSFCQPLLAFITCGFDEALEIFLAEGFDPLEVHGIDGLNALDVAREQENAGAEMAILSHVARCRASEALKEILADGGAPGNAP